MTSTTPTRSTLLNTSNPSRKMRDDSIERICQVLGRTFEWVAEADEPSEKGLRAAVVLYCVRSDLIGRESLEDLAFSLHYTESEVDNLVTNFCHAINWR